MEKNIAMLMGAGGAVLVVLSIWSLNIPDMSNWFPVLLLGGGALGWFGFKRYREA